MLSEKLLAGYALSITLVRVIGELTNRGLSVNGEPQALQARLILRVYLKEARASRVPVGLISEDWKEQYVTDLSPNEPNLKPGTQSSLLRTINTR